MSAPVLPAPLSTRTHTGSTSEKPSPLEALTTKLSAATVPFPVSPSRKRPATSSSTKASSTPIDTIQLRNDRLGTLVSNLMKKFEHAGSWETFATDFRGRSYLSDNIDDLDHPAADLLRTWRDEGVPAGTSSQPWTREQKDECLRRGCHPSATLHSTFLREEMAEFIENKFWAVLPYELVRDLQELMLSPAAVKEERDRKPRLLCDHSWPWPWGSVNEATVAHAPPEAMQFGGALPRLLYYVRHQNPRFGPLKGAKHDIKDGYYRMFLKVLDCL